MTVLSDERWITLENIARFRKRLEGPLAAPERRHIEKLLMEEEQRLKQLGLEN